MLDRDVAGCLLSLPVSVLAYALPVVLFITPGLYQNWWVAPACQTLEGRLECESSRLSKYAAVLWGLQLGVPFVATIMSSLLRCCLLPNAPLEARDAAELDQEGRAHREANYIAHYYSVCGLPARLVIPRIFAPVFAILTLGVAMAVALLEWCSEVVHDHHIICTIALGSWLLLQIACEAQAVLAFHKFRRANPRTDRRHAEVVDGDDSPGMHSNGLWRWTQAASPKSSWDPHSADLSMSPPLDILPPSQPDPPHLEARQFKQATRRSKRGALADVAMLLVSWAGLAGLTYDVWLTAWLVLHREEPIAASTIFGMAIWELWVGLLGFYVVILVIAYIALLVRLCRLSRITLSGEPAGLACVALLRDVTSLFGWQAISRRLGHVVPSSARGMLWIVGLVEAALMSCLKWVLLLLIWSVETGNGSQEWTWAGLLRSQPLLLPLICSLSICVLPITHGLHELWHSIRCAVARRMLTNVQYSRIDDTSAMPSPEDCAGFASMYTFWWSYPTLKLAAKNKKLEKVDLPKLPASDNVDELYRRFVILWSKKKDANLLMLLVWSSQRKLFLYSFVHGVFFLACMFADPLILNPLLQSGSTDVEAGVPWKQLGLVALLSVSMLIRVTCMELCYFGSTRVMNNARSILVRAIFCESMHMDPNDVAWSSGKLTNLMATDADKLGKTS